MTSFSPLFFRVEWGYSILYSRRHYHPRQRWDGRINCAGGAIRLLARLDFPVLWWGPCHSPEVTSLSGDSWTSVTQRGMAGLAVEADATDEAEFSLATAQGEFRFTARELRAAGRLVFPVDLPCGHTALTVTLDGHYWFRPAPRVGEVIVDPSEFRGARVVDWSRMRQAWLEPGQASAFSLDLPPGDGDGYWLFHLKVMTALPQGKTNAYAPEMMAMFPFLAAVKETQARDYLPITLNDADGRELASIRYYLRWHDAGVQILHDVWLRVPSTALPSGAHMLRLTNRHPGLALLIERLAVRFQPERHLHLSAPSWAMVGRESVIGVRTLLPGARLRLDIDEADGYVVAEPGESALPPGVHEFRVCLTRPKQGVGLRVKDLAHDSMAEMKIDAVYAMAEESPPIRVGYDMTTVPHDESGDMDWLLAYTHRTQLANLVVFRPFTPPVDGAAYARWGEYCRRHGIGVMAVGGYEDGRLIEAAGEEFLALGMHERSFPLYAQDPDGQTRDIRHACERYIDFIRKDVESNWHHGRAVSYGDASGGHHYSLLAGADALRAETMVAHTTVHLSQARGAARCLGNGQWGVHIAMQHCFQPNLETHLGAYHLSLYQAWIMGANFLYEEDSLFLMFKEERQCWEDALTRGKRDQTREFYRFAATHPRRGHPQVPIGVLLGRYAPPFNGFICGTEQTPDYPVWGRFGRNAPGWGHCQPEKGFHVLDVLMPGASVQPLRQRYDRRRLFFSGSPAGEFDQVPIDAPLERLNEHKLLLLLGWNTAEAADLDKLEAYVDHGGTLLLAVPHLSRHTDRQFLTDMAELNLIEPERVRMLCGVSVQGRGKRYSGSWQATGEEFRDAVCPHLSRAPNRAPDEDGPCHAVAVDLYGAETVIVDPVTNMPLVTRFARGAGAVYLLTTWAYPGHEELADLSGALVSALAKKVRGSVFIDDPSRLVYWSVWEFPEQGCGQLCLLNTDWSLAGDRKTVTVRCPSATFPVTVTERDLTTILWTPSVAIHPQDREPYMELLAADNVSTTVRLHGYGQHRFRLYSRRPGVAVAIDGAAHEFLPLPDGGGEFTVTWNNSTAVTMNITIFS
jgi:hypothetical protein